MVQDQVPLSGESLVAPKFTSKIILFSLALAVCISSLSVKPALADSSVVQEQVIKFYLDPALVPDLNFAKAVLPKYVADMNAILSKNTSRRLVFDPETGIVLTSTKPQTDSGKLPLPTQGFEIWAHAVKTSNSVSYGGYAGMDKSGAGVLAGLKWTRLYDPESLAAGAVADYTIQLDHMLHELAHVFGAGIGEYYNLMTINDTTGLEPLLNIRLSNPADSYWSDKADFMNDPLLRYQPASTRIEYLASVQYSRLTATIISGAYRNGMPTFDHYTIRVLDQSGMPVPDANVKVWNVMGSSSSPSELLFDGFSDPNGNVVLPWGGTGPAHSAMNFLRLMKAYKDGRSIVQPRYFSIFDADSAMLVSQAGEISLSLQPQAPSVETFTSVGTKDGWVLESAANSQKGNALNVKAGTLQLGNDAANRQYRSILSFNTASLPDNAVITKVTIKILKQSVAGIDPFTAQGNLQVHIRRGFFSTKAALQGADFQANSSQGAVGIFDPQSVDNWYSAELDSQAGAFINLAGDSQFRLQFELGNDGNGTADYAKFFSGNAADETKRPQLIIEYYVP